MPFGVLKFISFLKIGTNFCEHIALLSRIFKHPPRKCPPDFAPTYVIPRRFLRRRAMFSAFITRQTQKCFLAARTCGASLVTLKPPPPLTEPQASRRPRRNRSNPTRY